MAKWFISDTHFFHENILTFRTDGGERVRPQFDTIAEMHDCIVTNWNARVKPNDAVYHLGDVAFKATEKADDLDRLMNSLNGRKYLTLGNHDEATKLVRYFQRIELWRVFRDEGFFCSHIPLPISEFRETMFQVHGHLHERTVGNPRYINVSVELTNYAPVHIDEILQTTAARRSASLPVMPIAERDRSLSPNSPNSETDNR